MEKIVGLLLFVCVSQIIAKLPLEDATATVNQLFTYQFDPNDFPNQEIKIVETGREQLPSWLHYDAANHELTGVPTAKDKGTDILSVGKEIFAINVVDPTRSQVAEPLASKEPIICKPHDSITVVYVKLNYDSDKLTPQKKSRTVRSISKFLSLKPVYISLTAQPKDLAETNTALVAGPGDAAPNSVLSTLSWIVGCGAVKSQHMDILEKLESSAKDGSVGKLLGIPVSGWQVQSNKPLIIKNRRLKRNVLATATPSPSSSFTTSREIETSSTTTVQPTVTSPTAPTDAATTSKVVHANRKPEVNSNLIPDLLTAYSGELFRWSLPTGLFTDPEGKMLEYELEDEITSNRIMRLEPWLIQKRENGDAYEIVGIPQQSMVNQIKRVIIRATDEKGESATAEIRIDITNDQFDLILETYTISVSSTPSIRSAAGDLYIALTLSQKLNIQKFTILESRKEDQRKIITFGVNKGQLLSCPVDENKALSKMLHDSTNRSEKLKGREAADFLLITKVIRIRPKLPCIDSSPVPSEEKLKAYKKIKVFKGELYEQILPKDLYSDREDGDLTNLKVKLLAEGSDECESWMCYNATTRTLQALTWDDMSIKPQFELVVEDSAEHEVEQPIEVDVVMDYGAPTHLLTVRFDNSYSTFANSLSNQVVLYKKLGTSFPNHIVQIERVTKGSLILQFRLKPKGQENAAVCPVAELKNILAILFNKEEINESFIESMKPYQVSKVEFLPEDVCANDLEPLSAETERTTNPITKESTEPSSTPIIIIVVVVITVIAIIVIVVIIICIRRKKQDQLQTTGHIEKGVPRVLEEEMKDIDNHEEQPLVNQSTKDETYKPTTKPPAYPSDDKKNGYQPPTPPVSEPDEHRELDKSL